MRKIILFTLFALIAFASSCSAVRENVKAESVKETRVIEEDVSTEVEKGDEQNLVLVELFTSEGCSSCPPADRALAKLDKEQPIGNTEVIGLAFHVDYWDYLGWKDEFSTAKYSQRQREYVRAFNLDSSYTPQMVVDGKYEFVGSRYSTALSEIGKAAKEKKAQVDITVKKELLKPSLKVSISGLDTKEDSDVWLAVSEDNLTTNVKRGENGGKKLSHVSVVRSFEQVGYVATGVDKFETNKTVTLDKKWKSNNLNFVVFVQNKNSKNIVAVGKATLK